jgi:hypothetical protein
LSLAKASSVPDHHALNRIAISLAFRDSKRLSEETDHLPRPAVQIQPGCLERYSSQQELHWASSGSWARRSLWYLAINFSINDLRVQVRTTGQATKSPRSVPSFFQLDIERLAQTFASYPYNIYPTLSLSNGSLRAYRASGSWLTNATAVTNGGLLSWYTSTLFDHDAARIYTAVQYHGPSRLRVLAAYEIDDLWALCPFEGALGQTSVLFNVSANLEMGGQHLGFNPRRCWEVRLHLVPVGNGEPLFLSCYSESEGVTICCQNVKRSQPF